MCSINIWIQAHLLCHLNAPGKISTLQLRKWFPSWSLSPTSAPHGAMLDISGLMQMIVKSCLEKHSAFKQKLKQVVTLSMNIWIKITLSCMICTVESNLYLPGVRCNPSFSMLLIFWRFKCELQNPVWWKESNHFICDQRKCFPQYHNDVWQYQATGAWMPPADSLCIQQGHIPWSNHRPAGKWTTEKLHRLCNINTMILSIIYFTFVSTTKYQGHLSAVDILYQLKRVFVWNFILHFQVALVQGSLYKSRWCNFFLSNCNKNMQYKCLIFIYILFA